MRHLVMAFWSAMQTNDFALASTHLHEDFEHFMPQSGEYLRGRDAFAAFNQNYPAAGTWSFSVNAVVAEDDMAVSDVSVTDGAIRARAVTFHWAKDGLIWRQKEFWPDPFPTQAWRAPWVTVPDTAPF